MDNDPQLNDLRLFCAVARKSSFIAVARDSGVAPTSVSKRIAMLEEALGVKLFHRTTRRVHVTDEGAKIYLWAQKILDDVEDMHDDIATTRGDPRGLIRISSSARLGRELLTPALSRFKQRYPAVEVWLELLDRRADLVGEGFHLDIRAGEVNEPHLIPHRVAVSSRILCAAPSYIARHGAPAVPGDLINHDCILLREREEPFGTWRLIGPRGHENAKVAGTMASNDIDVVLRWVHDGHGVAFSADWLFAKSLAKGALVRVLPDWYQPADIWAVSTSRSAQSAKVRVCLEFLTEQIAVEKQLIATDSP